MFGIFSRIRRLEVQNEINTKMKSLSNKASDLGLSMESEVKLLPNNEFLVSMKMYYLGIDISELDNAEYTDLSFLDKIESYLIGYEARLFVEKLDKSKNQQQSTSSNSQGLTPLEVDQLLNKMEELRKEATPNSPKKKKK